MSVPDFFKISPTIIMPVVSSPGSFHPRPLKFEPRLCILGFYCLQQDQTMPRIVSHNDIKKIHHSSNPPIQARSPDWRHPWLVQEAIFGMKYSITNKIQVFPIWSIKSIFIKCYWCYNLIDLYFKQNNCHNVYSTTIILTINNKNYIICFHLVQCYLIHINVFKYNDLVWH